MSKPIAKTLLKYGITVGIDLALAALYFFYNIPLSQITVVGAVDLCLILCDAFFIPGVFTLMIGLLMWVASEGGLDAVGYLGSCLMKTLLPGRHGTFERYGDYVARKREKRTRGGMGFLCIVGLVFLLIACVFMVLFYTV